MTPSRDSTALFCVAVLGIGLIVTGAGGMDQNRKINQLQHAVKVESARSDMLSRQVAQLNGRVFLGTEIPDTTSGVQK